MHTDNMTLRTIAVTILVLTASLGAKPAHAQDPVKHSNEICTGAYLNDSAEVSGVLFQSFENPKNGETCIRATKNGKVLLQRTNDNDGAFTLGQKAADGEQPIPTIPNGTDLTGRGRPNMLISEWSGGAHCCRTDYIFELGPRFRLVATINARDADLSHFAKLDDTGRYYYFSADYIFAYWYGSFAGSPVEEIILEYRDHNKGGGFHLALEKMRQPSPTKPEWDKALAKVKEDMALKRGKMWHDELRGDLWGEVLHLLYTGHSDLAWKFLHEAGPEAQTEPDPDLADFCSTLKASDYWQDLEPTITDIPATCRRAKPGR